MTINEVTKALLSLCNDDDCHSLVQSAQQQTLDQLDGLNSREFCQRLSYCPSEHSSHMTPYLSRLSANFYHHIGSAIEGLDQRLETALSSDVCFQHGQLRPMCEHLLASSQSRRYANLYMALLKNTSKFIDDDLREQMTTKVNVDVCHSCKNAVQSSKDFMNNALVRTIRIDCQCLTVIYLAIRSQGFDSDM